MQYLAEQTHSPDEEMAHVAQLEELVQELTRLREVKRTHLAQATTDLQKERREAWLKKLTEEEWRNLPMQLQVLYEILCH